VCGVLRCGVRCLGLGLPSRLVGGGQAGESETRGGVAAWASPFPPVTFALPREVGREGLTADGWAVQNSNAATEAWHMAQCTFVELCGFSTTSPKVLFCHVQIINIDLVVV
jgi:hypothetical protein